MHETAPVEPEAGFVTREGVRLFTVVYPGVEHGPLADVGILHAPAFGDEMNKCRHVVAAQARRFAHLGATTLVLDLHGTGDSEGDLVDVTWETWLEDLRFGLRLIAGRGLERRWLWGLRTGGLLAAELAAADDTCVEALILWAPVLKGSQYIKQLLRVRVAAAMMHGKGRESVAGLRDMLRTEGRIEIAGYEFNDTLAGEMEGRSLPVGGGDVPVHWFEPVAEAGAEPSPAVRQTAARWAESGPRVRLHAVPADNFWATQELATAPTLVSVTADTMLAEANVAQTA